MSKPSPVQALHAVALLVPDYDAAIAYYCDLLGWQLVEDIDQGHKRWVRILPPGATQGSLILARATGPVQDAAIGNLDLSRFDAAPLIAFTAAKETNYGHRKNG